jgi:hypothetical protein
VALLKSPSSAQSIGVAFAAIFHVVAGMLHFINPDAYLKIMPPYIPWRVAMVRLSGVSRSLVDEPACCPDAQCGGMGAGSAVNRSLSS